MFQRVGEQAYKKDLGNITELCRLLDDPHLDFPTIHIAGTNGKGSTSHGLASVFQSAGYKTGLYTSPHYIDFRERIRINGVMISEDAVVKFVEDNKEDWVNIQPSFFEISVAMAFDHFRNNHVDIAIIETGLGGRLDSTNIITPKISVITNIGFDHMNLLGNTLEEIAFEKAGIIKHRTPVVIGEWDEITSSVFLKKAKETLSPICFASTDFDIEIIDQEIDHSTYQIFEIEAQQETILVSDLTGAYQKQNLRTIWASIKIWNESYPLNFISPDFVKIGLSKVKTETGMMGRWMKIQEDPLVITDAGHNEHGILAMLPMLLSLPAAKRHFILGFVSDKEIRKVLRHFPEDGIYYWVCPDIPRGLDNLIVKGAGADLNLIGETYQNMDTAYRAALSNASKVDLIFVGGSSYIVGDFLNCLQQTGEANASH